MKKPLKLLTELNILRPVRAYAWSGETHDDITSHAAELIKKENKQKIYSFYFPYLLKLSQGAKEPDKKGDIDKGPGTHYYSNATSKGKALPFKEGYYQNRLGSFMKSARTSLEENYTSALNLYKSGRIEPAMYVLGRALHFIEDISCPVHTANIQYKDKATNAHYAFEKHAINISGKYPPSAFDKRLIKTYSGDSFENAANKLAAAANRHAAAISTLDPIAFENAVKEMVPLAAQNAAALMMRFYDDCKSDNGNFLLDGKTYSFRNEASNLMLTASPKGLTCEKNDRKPEQKFTLILSDMGTFALKTAEGGCVSSSLKGYDYLKMGSQGAQFRAYALGDRRFRITGEASGYSKVLTCSKSGAPVWSDFVPGDKSRIWIAGS